MGFVNPGITSHLPYEFYKSVYTPPSNLRALPGPHYSINAGGEGSGYIFSSNRSSSNRALPNPEPTISEVSNTAPTNARATRIEEVEDLTAGINGEGEGGYIFSSNRSAPRSRSSAQNHSDEREVEDIRDLAAELREAEGEFEFEPSPSSSSSSCSSSSSFSSSSSSPSSSSSSSSSLTDPELRGVNVDGGEGGYVFSNSGGITAQGTRADGVRYVRDDLGETRHYNANGEEVINDSRTNNQWMTEEEYRNTIQNRMDLENEEIPGWNNDMIHADSARGQARIRASDMTLEEFEQFRNNPINAASGEPFEPANVGEAEEDVEDFASNYFTDGAQTAQQEGNDFYRQDLMNEEWRQIQSKLENRAREESREREMDDFDEEGDVDPFDDEHVQELDNDVHTEPECDLTTEEGMQQWRNQMDYQVDDYVREFHPDEINNLYDDEGVIVGGEYINRNAREREMDTFEDEGVEDLERGVESDIHTEPGIEGIEERDGIVIDGESHVFDENFTQADLRAWRADMDRQIRDQFSGNENLFADDGRIVGGHTTEVEMENMGEDAVGAGAPNVEEIAVDIHAEPPGVAEAPELIQEAGAGVAEGVRAAEGVADSARIAEGIGETVGEGAEAARIANSLSEGARVASGATGAMSVLGDALRIGGNIGAGVGLGFSATGLGMDISQAIADGHMTFDNAMRTADDATGLVAGGVAFIPGVGIPLSIALLAGEKFVTGIIKGNKAVKDEKAKHIKSELWKDHWGNEHLKPSVWMETVLEANTPEWWHIQINSPEWHAYWKKYNDDRKKSHDAYVKNRKEIWHHGTAKQKAYDFFFG
ncbi:hypothetical protein FACS189472_11720 [Alphaproteobacteria bacterium]|nr:hypothetical protein FACS189472_11720 [Alphaproteobacteria bacterium]